MGGDRRVGWATCSENECQGIRLHTGDRCLAHADSQDRDAELKRFTEEGRLDARGVKISAELLGRILDAAPPDEDRPNRPRLPNVQFDGATFDDYASFEGATSGHDTQFAAATFTYSSFDRATFGNRASFDQVRFGRLVSFDDVKIGDWAELGPLVAKELTLRRATFGRSPDVAISANRLRCQQAKFPDGARLRVRWAEVVLDNADFGRPSVLEATSALDGFIASAEKELVQDPLTDPQPYRTAQPRPVCLAGCDIHNLLLVDCDLRAGRFTGAHNLAALRLEGTIALPSAPPGWQAAWTPPLLWRWGRRQTIAEEHYWRQLQPRPQGWRGAPPPDPSPYVAEWHDHGERGDPSNPHGPREVASVYRALRKGREDNKDEPGAADFYYGEMEMRRHDATKPKAERLVLWLYWATSGYALRASRALAWLLGILVLATVLLAAVGLAQPATVSTVQATITGSPPNQTIRLQAPTAAPDTPPFGARVGTAALVAVEGAVFRASEQQLTYVGRLIQATLRFVGPILLALAVLSIRGRVKR
jgi:hypothetical protein